MKEGGLKNIDILFYIDNLLREEAIEYAKDNMDEDDWILVGDAYEVYPIDKLIIKNNTNPPVTIKRSKQSKFKDLYLSKVDELVNRLVKGQK